MDPIDGDLTRRTGSTPNPHAAANGLSFAASSASSRASAPRPTPPANGNPTDLSTVSPFAGAPPVTDFDTWMQKLIDAKREALRRASEQSGGGTPVNPDKPVAGASGPLTVKAHGFYEGSTFVPVQQIRIYEVGNYGHRTYQSFAGGWPEYSLKMPNARVGKSYKVKITWANGYSETRDVRMTAASGANLDVYRY